MVAFSSRNTVISQGPELGDVLEEIEYAIVDGELENDRQAIHAYLRGEKMSDFIVEKLSKSVGDKTVF